jgi:hypothetical protein
MSAGRFGAVLVVTGTLCHIAFAQSPTVKPPRQIAQDAFPSIALLVMQDSQGQPVSLGSGFVLRDGLVVTNRHVIAGASSGYCKLVGKSAKYEISGTAAVDEAHDLAILAVQGLKAPRLVLGDSNQVAVGDEVYAVGNPEGLEGTFSQGIVSAIRHIGSDTVLQMTAPISPGSSGGPILDASGKVVGIAVATFSSGQNLNLAIPSSYLTSLAASVTVEIRSLSRLAATPEKDFLTGDLGQDGIKGVIGENFAWFNYISGYFSFSLRNQLRQSVKWVRCMVVFYDKIGNPVDAKEERFTDVIPGGLAKRIATHVDDSVHSLSIRVEIRVLDFRIAE